MALTASCLVILTADPLQDPQQTHKHTDLTQSCKLPQPSITVSICRGSGLFFRAGFFWENQNDKVSNTLWIRSQLNSIISPTWWENCLIKPQPERDNTVENMSRQFTYLEYHPPKSTTRATSSLQHSHLLWLKHLERSMKKNRKKLFLEMRATSSDSVDSSRFPNNNTKKKINSKFDWSLFANLTNVCWKERGFQHWLAAERALCSKHNASE